MIRWNFIVPRVLILLLLAVTFRIGLNPAISWLTTQSLQSVFKSKVEIGATRTGLFPPRLQYEGIRIADPRKGKHRRNLFEADQINFLVDGNSLLRRRTVIKDGSVNGIVLNTERDAPGHLDRHHQQTLQTSKKSNDLSEWIGTTSLRIQDGAISLMAELEIVRESSVLREIWQEEYNELQSQLDQLVVTHQRIATQATKMDNPLRDMASLEASITEAREATELLVSLRAKASSLPKRFDADLASLKQAKENDLGKLLLYVPNHFDVTRDFGRERMLDVVRYLILDAKNYIQHGERIANLTLVAPKSERMRGNNYPLDSNNHPNFLIRHCHISGLVRHEGEDLLMKGTIENLANTSALLRKPSRIKFSVEGKKLFHVEYAKRETTDRGISQVTLHWPQGSALSNTLNSTDRIGLQAKSNRDELWIQVRKEYSTSENRYSGRLISKQSGVEIKISPKPEYSELLGIRSIQENLAKIEQIEIDASFHGDDGELEFKFDSNLDQAIKSASTAALQMQAEHTKKRLSAEISKRYQQEVFELTQWITASQSELNHEITSIDQKIDAMKRSLVKETGNAEAYLSRLRGNLRPSTK
ncbi:TIGR03545 family protein [Rhodopirellula sp.]|nr:TIGR03545 family protein [Rhodopirellula sp.]MDB4679197.1 TIGR03545 family protein [Rhodopirellula sp.]